MADTFTALHHTHRRYPQLFRSSERIRVMLAIATEPGSASDLAEELGLELAAAAKHLRDLHDLGYVELVEERSGGARRGGVERFYRSVG